MKLKYQTLFNQDHKIADAFDPSERFVLSLTNEGGRVLDPFLGTGTSIIAAIRHGRRGFGAETVQKYIELDRERIRQEIDGVLRTRPMDRPVYDPVEAGNSLIAAPWNKKEPDQQMRLLEKSAEYGKGGCYGKVSLK